MTTESPSDELDLDLELGYLNIFDYPGLYSLYYSDDDPILIDDLNDTEGIWNKTTEHQERPDVWYWRVGLFAGGGSGICCAGVVCNIIAIIVLLNIRKKSSAPFLLISLACLESAFLLSYLFLENILLLSWGGLITPGYAEDLKPTYSILYPLPHIFQTCLAYLVVVITLERYVVVAWPFRARELCRLKSARTALFCVVIYSVLYHIPTYAAFTFRKVWFNETQTWEYDFIRSDFGNSYFYNTIFIRRMHQIFNFGVPSVLLLVFNTLLVLALRSSTLSGSGSCADEARAAREKRLTVMVFSMTLLFMVVQLMEGIALAMLAGLSRYEEAPVPVNRFSAVADTLMLLNSATNFAIYCATGRQFRETFLRLFFHSWSCHKGRCSRIVVSNATKSGKEMHNCHRSVTAQTTLQMRPTAPLTTLTPVATRACFKPEVKTASTNDSGPFSKSMTIVIGIDESAADGHCRSSISVDSADTNITSKAGINNKI